MDRERDVNIFVRGRRRIVLIVVPIMRKEEMKQMDFCIHEIIDRSIDTVSYRNLSLMPLKDKRSNTLT
jgi:hypothetical protein